LRQGKKSPGDSKKKGKTDGKAAGRRGENGGFSYEGKEGQ